MNSLERVKRWDGPACYGIYTARRTRAGLRHAHPSAGPARTLEPRRIKIAAQASGPGFFQALAQPFDRIPDLFSSTAQIRFPAGARREETGKTVMSLHDPEAFPVRCDVPLPGEDQSYVLYGSGGCSLYDAAKLAALGNVDEVYDPAYVEDLDIGYRAWPRGWPPLFVAGAIVEHRHRATTARFYTEQQLAEVLEINYLKFLTRATSDPKVFR